MKIGREYVMVAIGGLFLLARVLEAGVKPLNLNLASPYQFLAPGYFRIYPFTGAIILIRGLALFLSPLWLVAWFGPAPMAKGVTLLVLSGLMQLYALQQIAGAGAPTVSQEWALALTIAGLGLLLPTVLFLLQGLLHSAHQKITAIPNPFTPDDDNDDD
jgi:hypothetical protein